MALTETGYFLVLGKPVVFWLGIATISPAFATAIPGHLIHKGKAGIQLKWHIRLAGLSLALAVVHGILAAAACV